MKEFLSNLLKKLLPKNVAGILGVIQTAIPFIREVLMLATRVCAVVIPGDRDDKIVRRIKIIFDNAEAMFKRVKDFFLSVGA